MTTSNPMYSDLGLTDKNSGCACGPESHGAHGDHDATAATTPELGGIREEYLVEGMTCNHCVASVTEEVSAIDGVASVSVDLQVGGASRVSVVSERPVAAEQIRDAVTEAGYTLVAG